MTATLVRNFADLENDCRYGIIIASAIGSKKAALIAAAAKEKGFTVLNMRKVKRAKGIARGIEKKTPVKKTKKETTKEHKEGEHVHKEEHVHKDGEHPHDHKENE